MSQMIQRDFLLFQQQYVFHIDLKKFLEPDTQWHLCETWFKEKYVFFMGWFLKLWKYSSLSLYIWLMYVSITRHRNVQSMKKGKAENANNWVKSIW